MPNYFNYQSYLFFASLVIGFLTSYIFDIPLIAFVVIIIVPQLFNQLWQFTTFRKLQQGDNFYIFGLTKSALIKERFVAVIAGVALIAFTYLSIENKWCNGELNAIWMTMLGYKIIEIFLPYANWNVIVYERTVYMRKIFNIESFQLSSNPEIRKITNDKIELHQNSGCIELKILDEELTKFQQIIHNLNPEINPN